jgi:hypothetical protein
MNIFDKKSLDKGRVKLNKKGVAVFIITFLIIVGFSGLFAIIIIPIAYVVMLFSAHHRILMQSFGNKHKLEFKSSIDHRQLSARIFKQGHSRSVTNSLTGDYKKHPINIFNYRYSDGHGKNQSNFSFTVAEIEIKKTIFPHIFLKSDKMWHHVGRDFFGINKDARIKLEQPFEKKFNLYCTQDYEIETLQIFDKSLLQTIVDFGNKFSIEFADNKIYIFDNRFIYKEKKLENLLELVDIIIEKSSPLLHRLSDDFESLHEVYRK